MENYLQPPANSCRVSGAAFVPGDRVVSYLVSDPEKGEIAREDLLESAASEYAPAGAVICRWVRVHKPRPSDGAADRAMKLTAENLFLTLADPTADSTPENVRLVRFLALLLERKRILRPRGRTTEGATILEHAGSRQRFEVPGGPMDEAFFTQVHAQLAFLVGTSEEPATIEPGR